MAYRLSHTAEIQEEVIRALLVNGPAITQIAEELSLTPREVRNILHETLLQFDESNQHPNDLIPIVANPPLPPMGLRTDEINMLLGRAKEK